jgi:hypothetical protein
VVVKDTTGAVILGACVDAAVQGTGRFVIAEPVDAVGTSTLQLTPGLYSLRIGAPEFRWTVLQDVNAASAGTFPVVLEVASIGGSEVVPMRSMLETEKLPITPMSQSAPATGTGYTPVTVVVTDASGAVIPGAEIRVTPGSPAGDRLITDERGQVQLGIPAGKYTVQARAQGFSTVGRALEVADKAQTMRVTLRPAPPSGGPVEVMDGPSPMQPGAVPLESTVEKPHAKGASEPAAANANTLVIVGTGGQRWVFTPATVKDYPHQTVTIFDHHTNANETYSGVPLIDLLAHLGVPRGKDLMGKALADYVVATGSDGYKSVVALGEIDPEFHPGMVLVADAMDGKPLDKTGPFRLVVTEDKRPARSVRNLVKLELRVAE